MIDRVNIGTDIVEIKRIRHALLKHQQRFLNRIFTEQEQAYCLNLKNPYPSLAGRFAAKEAVAKALGCGIGKSLQWKEMEIIRKNNHPLVLLSERAQREFHIQRITLSISHSRDYAVATVLIFQ